MPCAKCGCDLLPDETHEMAGKLLCDDCYMDALSPAKTCDPWATYTSSRLKDQTLTPQQQAILDLIDQKGPVTPEQVMSATGLKSAELERCVAALRHMEMLRGAPRPGGGKVLLRFNSPDPA